MEETKEVRKKDLHDLKSGLTAVMGYVQLAQKKAEELSKDESTSINLLLDQAIEAAKSLEVQIRELEGIREPLMDL